MEKIELFENDLKERENGIIKKNVSYAVLNAYENTQYVHNDLLNFDKHIWSSEIPSAFHYMKQAGIKEFTISNHSTGLMITLEGFTELGCTIAPTLVKTVNGMAIKLIM